MMDRRRTDEQKRRGGRHENKNIIWDYCCMVPFGLRFSQTRSPSVGHLFPNNSGSCLAILSRVKFSPPSACRYPSIYVFTLTAFRSVLALRVPQILSRRVLCSLKNPEAYDCNFRCWPRHCRGNWQAWLKRKTQITSRYFFMCLLGRHARRERMACLKV